MQDHLETKGSNWNSGLQGWGQSRDEGVGLDLRVPGMGQSRGTQRPGPHLPALLGVLVKRGDIPGVLVWSQLTCVIRPGLAPVASQDEQE